MIITTGNILLIGSVLLFVSIAVSKAGSRSGVPLLLLFLCVGMLFGVNGLGIQFNNVAVAQFVGMIALCVILFSGGMDTSFEEIRPVIGPGVTLATVGVILTAAITGGFIFFVAHAFGYNISIEESMLMAAVMSSTDSASVFSILRSKRKELKQRLRPLLELESGSNDPMAYMLTILLIELIMTGGTRYGHAAMMFVVQLCVGALAGYLLGRLISRIINKINLENHSLYPVLLLSGVFFVFSFTELIKGNGYLAVYLAGLVIGNKRIVYKKSLTTFFDGFAWLFQIVMFLTLGLLVNPVELLPVAGLGLLVGFFMIIFARPITVFLSLAPFKGLTARARVYISWVGLRGAVPIIFATYPLIAGTPNASLIFNVVFFITIISLLVQGTTLGWMADRLGLSKEKADTGFEVYLPDKIKAALSEVKVVSALLRNGNHMKDLTLPANTLVVLVRRDDHFFVPGGSTELQIGDYLLVISEKDQELQAIYGDLGITSSTIK